MADWTRDTPWRQGSLVARDDLRAIGVSVEEQHVCGLVISHDCDLANDRLDHEPWVELVLLEPLGKLDPNLTYGKNPRRLHFQIGNASEEVECYEAHARTRLMLHKTDLAPFEPVPGRSPDAINLDILRRWLACRYRRQALPDALMRRIGPMLDFITHQAKDQIATLVGIWLAFDPPEEVGEDSFTLLDMRRTVELKTEYLSFRGTEPGPMVS